ncbi:MAG: phage tail protein [bacterium]|nr:phage tail protein [bacterium]
MTKPTGIGERLKAAVLDKLATLVVAAAVAIVASIGTWFVTITNVVLDEVQLHDLAKKLSEDSRFAARVATLAGSPVGSVVAWPAAQSPPSGWAPCIGQAIEASPQDRIVSVLGITYDADGTGRVQLPDFQGYFLQGAGQGDESGSSGGAGKLAFQLRQGQMGSPEATSHGIREVVALRAAFQSNPRPNKIFDGWAPDTRLPKKGKDNYRVLDNRPPFVAVQWIIRVK